MIQTPRVGPCYSLNNQSVDTPLQDSANHKGVLDLMNGWCDTPSTYITQKARVDPCYSLINLNWHTSLRNGQSQRCPASYREVVWYPFTFITQTPKVGWCYFLNNQSSVPITKESSIFQQLDLSPKNSHNKNNLIAHTQYSSRKIEKGKLQIFPISKIQLVVYYQRCILIGWATTRLYVIAH